MGPTRPRPRRRRSSTPRTRPWVERRVRGRAIAAVGDASRAHNARGRAIGWRPPRPRRRTGAWTEADVGQRIAVVNRRSRDRFLGTVRFVGSASFQDGQSPTLWLGIALDKRLGRHDGEVKGIRYFSCRPLHGIFRAQARRAGGRRARREALRAAQAEREAEAGRVSRPCPRRRVPSSLPRRPRLGPTRPLLDSAAPARAAGRGAIPRRRRRPARKRPRAGARGRRSAGTCPAGRGELRRRAERMYRSYCPAKLNREGGAYFERLLRQYACSPRSDGRVFANLARPADTRGRSASTGRETLTQASHPPPPLNVTAGRPRHQSSWGRRRPAEAADRHFPRRCGPSARPLLPERPNGARPGRATPPKPGLDDGRAIGRLRAARRWQDFLKDCSQTGPAACGPFPPPLRGGASPAASAGSAVDTTLTGRRGGAQAMPTAPATALRPTTCAGGLQALGLQVLDAVTAFLAGLSPGLAGFTRWRRCRNASAACFAAAAFANKPSLGGGGSLEVWARSSARAPALSLSLAIDEQRAPSPACRARA